MYAGTSGHCLLRNTDEIDEAERDRAVRDFEAGALLVVDGPRDEVRGLVPIVRGGEEAFVFVVDIPSGWNPIRTFYRTVTTIVNQRDGWTLNDQRQTGAAVRMMEAVRESGTPSPAVERDGDLLADRTQSVTLTEAVAALDRGFETDERTLGRRPLVVSEGRQAAHVEDAQYMTVGGEEAESGRTEGTEKLEERASQVATQRPVVRPLTAGLGGFLAVAGFWWLFVGPIGPQGAFVAAGVGIMVALVASKSVVYA